MGNICASNDKGEVPAAKTSPQADRFFDLPERTAQLEQHQYRALLEILLVGGSLSRRLGETSLMKSIFDDAFDPMSQRAAKTALIGATRLCISSTTPPCLLTCRSSALGAISSSRLPMTVIPRWIQQLIQRLGPKLSVRGTGLAGLPNSKVLREQRPF